MVVEVIESDDVGSTGNETRLTRGQKVNLVNVSARGEENGGRGLACNKKIKLIEFDRNFRENHEWKMEFGACWGAYFYRRICRSFGLVSIRSRRHTNTHACVLHHH